ncbi:hypothetical protein AMATHDRAFT_76804 [Amanita thiersii Skay4041]|uniref:Phosphoribulokinase/uridine kinase domain-containing protein n=1 Tax=Amanita thiersii Skay4041 TaxID=703135 RepID=A0A2A9NKK2_9AGAR|nr:hypothetical protein AMATHDRAFT_76804 [Amanita thiersii Skay4041]
MEQDAAALARELVHRLQKSEPNRRLLVGISGIPASGKSTFAILLIEHLNALLQSQNTHISTAPATVPSHAILVGLDGWHLTRAQLDAMPDPKLAHDRRGIHWTFDGHSYVAFVRSLREKVLPESVITAPSFDHALKDPTPDAVSILACHRIVIIEGLYTFLSIDPWKEAALHLDERYLIQVDFKEAQHRLVNRHVLTGVAKDMNEAIWRAEENDMPNGRFMLSNILEPTRVIVSKHDPTMNSSRISDAGRPN